MMHVYLVEYCIALLLDCFSDVAKYLVVNILGWWSFKVKDYDLGFEVN